MKDLATTGAEVGRAAKPKPMSILPPVIVPLPLADDQYVKQKTAKTHIFTHHTAGSTAAGALAGWKATPQKIATAFIIDRDGTIYQAFSPDYWASHLGVKGHSWLEKCSIGIEIVAWGHLTLKNGKYTSYTGKEVPASEVVHCPGWRGQKYFHAYTPAQISAVKSLLVHLMAKYKISFQADRADFWQYRGAKGLPPGVWSHSTVRTDKEDIFPQAELTAAVMSL